MLLRVSSITVKQHMNLHAVAAQSHDERPIVLSWRADQRLYYRQEAGGLKPKACSVCEAAKLTRVYVSSTYLRLLQVKLLLLLLLLNCLCCKSLPLQQRLEKDTTGGNSTQAPGVMRVGTHSTRSCAYTSMLTLNQTTKNKVVLIDC